MSTRTLVLAGLVVSLLLAGVGSHYASSSPDGLMYVAELTGFSDTATDHAAEGSPLAGYALRGVTRAGLSGGLAGVIGVLVVGALAGGLAWVLRRRADHD